MLQSVKFNMQNDRTCDPIYPLLGAAVGGDLVLHNIPGYGVDVFLTLPYLDTSIWEEQQETSGREQVGAVGAQVGIQAATNLHQQLQQLENHGSERFRNAAATSRVAGDAGAASNGSDEEVAIGVSPSEASSDDDANDSGSSSQRPWPG
jgi:hypothetical protein